ncbi:hypothetical protein M271_00415 [Streptomyces rapamycinicus NRRL 5491]|nr:hypothetical protein M271_00415 [Streptomyces rapamycinicus NRRL 5491]
MAGVAIARHRFRGLVHRGCQGGIRAAGEEDDMAVLLTLVENPLPQ